MSTEQEEMLLSYQEMLEAGNRVMNLTAVTELSEVCTKHYLDSLSIVKAVDLRAVNTMIDVGTGAGFPGMVLKIMFPHINTVLLDSLNKRVGFLNDVISSLGLTDVEAVHMRAEDAAASEKYRESFDLCVSRAVASLSVLSEYCLPFVSEGGLFVAYKTQSAGEEIRDAAGAIKLLGGRKEKEESFFLPDTDMGRRLVVIRKIKPTDRRYPRKAGVPAKAPLK
ncbi:MAG: 16S rRNA (guanine(527)-N(7))-methyltransferase RsmG [Lachnospiraceae bacterium]|nr:16S rRNA (guanine(527)-N(7))-methyltransferase RsmG [Lachnospiraceae bacterium]